MALRDLLSSVTLLDGAPVTVPAARAEEKGLFSGSNIANAGSGLLAGVFPYGQPPKRGTRELLQMYKQHPWLRTILHRIARDTASVPWRIWSPTKGKAAKAATIRSARGEIRRNLLDHAIHSGALREIERHPFLDLLNNWNPALRGFASRMVVQLYIDLKGETFAIKERNGIGQVLELWPTPPHWVIQTPAVGQPWFRFSWMGFNKQIDEDDVHWIREPDPENPFWRGTGIGEALGDEIDLDVFVARHLKSFFFNRGMPDAVLSVEGLTDEDEAKRYEERLREKHQGVGKGFQIHVASGKTTVTELGQTFKEQQMTEMRRMERDTILSAFNFPPELAGIIENSNRATINTAYFLYATGVLCPRMDFQADALQPLLDEFDDSLLLDYVSPVPEDHEFKAKVYAMSPWAFSKNEVRKLAGDQPLPGGDDEFPPMPSGGGAPFGGDDKETETPSGKKPPKDGGEDDEPDGKAVARRKDWGDGDTENVLDALRPDRLTDQVEPTFKTELERWGNRVLGELGVTISFDIKNPLVRHAIDALAGTKIRHINATTRDALRDQLEQGAAAGEGIADLAKRVESVFDDAEGWRAEMIARTEVVGASNAGNIAAYTMSGVVAGKEWLAVQDTETRDTHRSLDGQRRALGELFVADNGDSTEYPGAFGDPAEDINCRCSVLPVVDDGKAAKSRADAHAAHEGHRASWTEAARLAFVRGFQHQRQDVLRALHARS